MHCHLQPTQYSITITEFIALTTCTADVNGVIFALLDNPHVPEIVSITPGLSSARIQWRDDRNIPCFQSQACSLEYYLTWQLSDGNQKIFSASTTSKMYIINNLHPGTEYTLTINAQCTKNLSLASRNSTVSVFITKGNDMSCMHESVICMS